jgi:hypothetical protein
MVHNGLDDHGVSHEHGHAEQVVIAALDRFPNPAMALLFLAQRARLDHVQQRLARSNAGRRSCGLAAAMPCDDVGFSVRIDALQVLGPFL